MLTDLLSGVYKIANALYETKGMSDDNKKLCKEMGERVGRIKFSVQDLSKGSNDPTRYQELLQPLEDCLKECLAFLNSLNPDVVKQNGLEKLMGGIKTIFNAKSRNDDFKKLNEKLGRVESDLTLALQSRSILYLREASQRNAEIQKALSSNVITNATNANAANTNVNVESKKTKDIEPSAANYTPPLTLLYQTTSKTSDNNAANSASSVNPSASYAPPSITLYNTNAATDSRAASADTRPSSPGQGPLKQKALEGDMNAQNDLAHCYYVGKGVAQSNEKAFFWFNKAAHQGHIVAQFNLGNCFYRGHGTRQDYALAVLWYTKAAESGDKDAQNNLGNCYKKGRVGNAPDLVKAVQWFTLAAKQGHGDAQFNLGACYHNGEGVKRDDKQAVEWYRQSMQQGNTTAKAYLGFCYEKGQGVEADLKKAAELYEQAAGEGDAFGKERLGKLQARRANS